MKKKSFNSERREQSLGLKDVNRDVNGSVKYFFRTHHQPIEITGETHTPIRDHPPSSLDFVRVVTNRGVCS